MRTAFTIVLPLLVSSCHTGDAMAHSCPLNSRCFTMLALGTFDIGDDTMLVSSKYRMVTVRPRTGHVRRETAQTLEERPRRRPLSRVASMYIKMYRLERRAAQQEVADDGRAIVWAPCALYFIWL